MRVLICGPVVAKSHNAAYVACKALFMTAPKA